MDPIWRGVGKETGRAYEVAKSSSLFSPDFLGGVQPTYFQTSRNLNRGEISARRHNSDLYYGPKI